jgi:hypothetical protein
MTIHVTHKWALSTKTTILTATYDNATSTQVDSQGNLHVYGTDDTKLGVYASGVWLSAIDTQAVSTDTASA